MIRSVTPARPHGVKHQDPEDAAEHATVLYTPNPTPFVRQHRVDSDPFVLDEFVGHDSALVSKLEPRLVSAHQPATADRGPADALNLLPLPSA